MDNEIKLQDLNLAAYLSMCGYGIELERTGNQVVFKIKKDEKLDNLIADWWGHKAVGDLLKYTAFLKEMKGRVASQR